jgi:hypothetical protein
MIHSASAIVFYGGKGKCDLRSPLLSFRKLRKERYHLSSGRSNVNREGAMSIEHREERCGQGRSDVDTEGAM